MIELKREITRGTLANLELRAALTIHREHHLLPAPLGLVLNYEACLARIQTAIFTVVGRLSDSNDPDTMTQGLPTRINAILRSCGFQEIDWQDPS